MQLAEIIGCQIVVAGKKLLVVHKRLYDGTSYHHMMYFRYKNKVILDFRLNKLISMCKYVFLSLASYTSTVYLEAKLALTGCRVSI